MASVPKYCSSKPERPRRSRTDPIDRQSSYWTTIIQQSYPRNKLSQITIRNCSWPSNSLSTRREDSRRTSTCCPAPTLCPIGFWPWDWPKFSSLCISLGSSGRSRWAWPLRRRGICSCIGFSWRSCVFWRGRASSRGSPVWGGSGWGCRPGARQRCGWCPLRFLCTCSRKRWPWIFLLEQNKFFNAL